MDSILIRRGAPKTIQPLIIYPVDRSPEQDVYVAVRQALDNVQEWTVRLTGRGFSFGPLAWTRSPALLPPDALVFAQETIAKDLEWPMGWSLAYLCLVRGSGFAGQVGPVWNRGSPFVVLGDIFIEGILGHNDEAARMLSKPGHPIAADHPRASRNGQVGTLAHELLHLAGLEDNSNLNSIMSTYLDRFPNIGLTGDEMIQLQASGWLI